MQKSTGQLHNSWHNFSKYRPLIRELVTRDLKVKYRRSVLGYVWSILNPLLMMLLQTLVFSYMFRFDIPNFPLYLICGNTLFNFFNESTNMGMGVAIPHGTSQKKGTVKKSGVVLLQYPQGVDFGDEKAYLVFGIAGVGNDHLDLLGNVCEILEDEDALEQLKTTSDMNYVLEHLQ